MGRKTHMLAFGALLLATALVPISASAEPKWTSYGKITQLSAGWKEDTLAVFLSAGIVNPGGCPTVEGGAVTNPVDPGHTLFHAVLLSAWLNSKEVALLVDGCVYSKPRIIGVNVR